MIRPSGLKRQEGLGRTIPVPWAVAGSSDTHRKQYVVLRHTPTSERSPGMLCEYFDWWQLIRVVDAELHAVLLKQLSDLNHEARHQDLIATRERMKRVIDVEDVRLRIVFILPSHQSLGFHFHFLIGDNHKARVTVLRGGADTVGRYTVDLIKKQKSRSGMLETNL